MNYNDFPRPVRDNGLGIHFGDVTLPMLDKYLPLLKALHLKWIVLCDGDPVRIGKVASVLSAEGIMPIARPDSKINGNRDFRAAAKQCNSPYVIVFNEMDNDREWKRGVVPKNCWEIAREKWIGGAHQVRSAGCYPGLQVTSPPELKNMLTFMKGEGETSLWDSMFLALHLYPHLGCPPWCDEHDDDVLGFLEYAIYCEDIMGFVPPMIVTEGGWTDGQGTPQDRAEWMVEVFEWFKYGTAPDYLLAFCPWILFGQIWYGFSWTQNERHQEMVRAVMGMGEFERGKPLPPIPPEKPRDWRVVGPWETEEEALEDLATLPLVGFAHYEMEKRK